MYHNRPESIMAMIILITNQSGALENGEIHRKVIETLAKLTNMVHNVQGFVRGKMKRQKKD